MAFKMDNKGIGASRFEKEAWKNGQADAWIGGGGELGDLFDRLNKASAAPVEPTEKKSRKEKGKSDKTGKDTPGDEHGSGCEASGRRKGKHREDRKGKEKGKEAEGEASPAVVEEAVRKVAAEMPHRMA